MKEWQTRQLRTPAHTQCAVSIERPTATLFRISRVVFCVIINSARYTLSRGSFCLRHDRRRYLISGARILMRSKHFKVAEEVGISIMRCVNSFSITAQNRISSASSSSSSPRVVVQFNNAQNPLSSRPSAIDKREEAGKGCSDNDVYISFSKRISSHTHPHT